MTFVIDTNVPKVANGGDWLDKAPECVIACVTELARIKESERVALDDEWLIVREYKKQLRESGEPGVGDAFLKWVLTNLYNLQRCDLVRPVAFPADSRLAGFDPNDRKFISVAIAHTERPRILQAVDAKWRAFAEALAENGAAVQFLCS